MELRRWTPLAFLFPGRYVSRDPRWAAFDLEEWSREEYTWTEDRWNGLRDFASRPAETVARGRGHCEDYALVAASWALANGRDGVGIAFCWKRPSPLPAHAIAFDDERVYSSGRIREGSVEGWLAESEYDFHLARRVR